MSRKLRRKENFAKRQAAKKAVESPLSEERIAVQEEVAGMNKTLLKGWSSCMSKKIVNHYGPEVKACTSGITHGNWEKILECMVEVLGITDPEVWIPEQIAYFTVWSAECIFSTNEAYEKKKADAKKKAAAKRKAVAAAEKKAAAKKKKKAPAKKKKK